MYVQQRTKIVMALIFAVLISLAVFGVSFYLFPGQQPSSNPTSTMQPGPYQPTWLSTQVYAILLLLSFVIAVTVTALILFFTKRRRQNKTKPLPSD
jgi:quinol-cytochrome oxidoreductase complex cytochrome b subunit